MIQSDEIGHQTNDNGKPPLDAIDYARTQAQTVERKNAAGTPAVPADLIPGYEILEEIHRGGQGVVYKGRRHSTGQFVAIKILRWGQLARPTDQIRFDRELRVLAELQHTNIVAVHDGGVRDDLRYFVMDYVRGRTLQKYAQESPPLETRLRVFLRICRAVDAAHRRGVIHRDMKPSNVIVDESGEPRVIDFGLAKLTDSNDLGLTLHQTTEGANFLGSLPWLAPEQAEGHSTNADARTDVYGLGTLMYVLLTKRPPFEIEGPPRRVLDAICHEEPQRPSALVAALDSDLDTITLKCLSKDPQRRYATASDLGHDVEQFLAGEPIGARRDSAWYLMRKAARRYRLAAAVAGAFGVLTLIYAVSITALYRRSGQEARALHTVLESYVQTASKKLGRIAGADGVRRELNQIAFAELVRLVDQKEDTPAVRSSLATSHAFLADAAENIHDLSAARDHTTKAREIFERLAKEQPDNLERQADLSIAIVRQGDIAGQLHLADEQLASYRLAMELDKRLVELAPNNIRFLDNLAWSYDRVAARHQAAGQKDLARLLHQSMHDIAVKLVERQPDNAIRLWALFTSEDHLIRADIESGDWSDVFARIDTVVPIAFGIHRLEPLNPFFIQHISRTMTEYCPLFLMHGQPDRGVPLAHEAEAALETLAALGELEPSEISKSVSVYFCHAELAAKLGDKQAESLAINRGADLLTGAAIHLPGNSKIDARLARFYAFKAQLAVAASDAVLARRYGEEAIRLAREAFHDQQASKETLEDCAAAFSTAAPEDIRDTTAAVAAYERIVGLPGFVGDKNFAVSFAALLMANGQQERAQAIAEKGLIRLSDNEEKDLQASRIR